MKAGVPQRVFVGLGTIMVGDEGGFLGGSIQSACYSGAAAGGGGGVGECHGWLLLGRWCQRRRVGDDQLKEEENGAMLE